MKGGNVYDHVKPGSMSTWCHRSVAKVVVIQNPMVAVGTENGRGGWVRAAIRGCSVARACEPVSSIKAIPSLVATCRHHRGGGGWQLRNTWENQGHRVACILASIDE